MFPYLHPDRTIQTSTATPAPSSPPPISIPFHFKRKRSLSPTAHEPPPNRSSPPAESSIPGSHPSNTSASPPPTTKPFRFKRRRSSSARPTYSVHPETHDSPPHHRSPSPGLHDPFHEKKPSSSKKPPKPQSNHKIHHHHHHHNPKRRRRSRRHHHHQHDDEDPPPPPPPPPPSSGPYPPQHHHHNTQWDAPTMDADTAFRESLFDAMADDEGAAFWEGVYGQPIHTYSAYYRTTAADDGDDDGDNAGTKPKLERMTDDEYVQYVRRKMYEKSQGYIREERAKREAAKKEAARKKKEGKQRRRWDLGVEEALRRGEERRRRAGKWKGVWDRYVGACNHASEVLEGKERYADRIRWPVLSGKREDVGREEIQKFFEHAPQSVGGGGDPDLLEVLKKERVKWHPDKMQQRAGEGGLDVQTTKLVTAVFQVIDRLWTEKKGDN